MKTPGESESLRQFHVGGGLTRKIEFPPVFTGSFCEKRHTLVVTSIWGVISLFFFSEVFQLVLLLLKNKMAFVICTWKNRRLLAKYLHTSHQI